MSEQDTDARGGSIFSNDPSGAVAEAGTPGTVLYGILGWRSDSQMLARMRPVLIDLVTDALRAECSEPLDPCLSKWPDERHRWCEGCCLRDISRRLQAVTRG